MTPKQQRFVSEYLLDLNATQAAIRSGYSPRTAYRTGADNLKKPQIAAAVAAAQAERSERTEVTQDWVIGRLVENVERSMRIEPVLDAEGEETGEFRYAGSVANKALELLGKHLGMFVERVDITSRGRVVVNLIPGDDGDRGA